MAISIPIISAVIGGLAGSIGTFVIQSYFRRQDENNEKRKLRKGLIAELENMHPLETWVEESEGEGVPDIEFMENSFFNSNLNRLGILTEEEIESCIEFDQNLMLVKDRINSFNQTVAVGDLSKDQVQHLIDRVNRNVESLEEKRKELVDLIDTNIDK